jgi:hypothetical protein
MSCRICVNRRQSELQVAQLLQRRVVVKLQRADLRPVFHWAGLADRLLAMSDLCGVHAGSAVAQGHRRDRRGRRVSGASRPAPRALTVGAVRRLAPPAGHQKTQTDRSSGELGLYAASEALARRTPRDGAAIDLELRAAVTGDRSATASRTRVQRAFSPRGARASRASGPRLPLGPRGSSAPIAGSHRRRHETRPQPR